MSSKTKKKQETKKSVAHSLTIPEYLWDQAERSNNRIRLFETTEAYLMDILQEALDEEDDSCLGKFAKREEHPAPPSLDPDDIRKVKKALEMNGIDVACIPEPKKLKTLEVEQPCFIKDLLTDDAEDLTEGIWVRFNRDGHHFNRPVSPHYAKVLRRIAREKLEAED